MKLQLLPVLATVVSSNAVTLVQKVIGMINDMLAKDKNGKHEEQVQFAAYKQFCDDTLVERKRPEVV